MTTIQFIDARTAALKAYEKILSEQVSIAGGHDRVSVILTVACLDAFGLGFDAAFKMCQEDKP